MQKPHKRRQWEEATRDHRMEQEAKQKKIFERIQRTYGAQIGMSLRKKFAELGGKKHGNRFNPQQRQLVPRLAQHVEKILTSFWLRQCDQLLAQTM